MTNRIQRAFFIALLHLSEHLVRDLFRNRRPDFDDLVVAFAVGEDGPVEDIAVARSRPTSLASFTSIFLLSGMTMSSMPIDSPDLVA